MLNLWQDIRFGFRMLRKNPGVTLVAIFLLAIGIGANAALFSLVYGVLLSPLPVAYPERTMWLLTDWVNGGEGSSSGPDYLDWKKENTVFEEMCAMQPKCKFNLAGEGTPVAAFGFRVTPDFFSVFSDVKGRDTIAHGRNFTPNEGKKENSQVLILGNRLWQSRYDGDPNIVGKDIIVNEEPYTVVGVCNPTMGFIEDMGQIYIPLPIEDLQQSRGNHYINIMGVLKEGVTVKQAQAEMKVIAARLQKEYPSNNANKSVLVMPLQEILIRDIKTTFLILYGAVGFLLLIACVNVANLLLAKSGARCKEIAIRNALGAGRFRIFRQMLTESVILALLGGGLGVLLAMWGLDFLKASAPKISSTGSIPGFHEIQLSPLVLSFTMVLSVATGILFGLVPAWQTSKTDINSVLKDTGRGSSFGSSRHSILNSLVVVQVALALVLLVGSGLLIKSFYHLQKVDPGFAPNKLLAVEMEIPFIPKNEKNGTRVRFYQQVLEKIDSLPGVAFADCINVHPMSSMSINSAFTIEGRPPLPPGEFNNAQNRNCSFTYHKTMKIPLLKGRYFTAQDNGTNGNVCIVNQEFVERHFPNEEPLGQKIKHNDRIKEIVGVVGNVKLRSLSTKETHPFMYEPIQQTCWHTMTILIRANQDPLSLANGVRQAVWDVNPNQPILRMRTMEQIIGDAISVELFTTILLSIMAGVALLMAVMGIYGVMSYSVSERTHEIGIRIALGAQVKDILVLIVTKGMVLTGIGAVIGLFGAYALSRVLQAILYKISATDLITFVLVTCILLVVSFLAAFLPARKAARTDPMNTLRCE